MKARVNGIEIDYEDTGTSAFPTGSGRAVLLSHGFSATRRMWNGQHAALADRYRVISWDMRGHGQTDSPDDPAQYSHALTVADMKGLLEHLGLRRAVIGGLSLGGTMALEFYVTHPEMAEALVICDSGPGYRNAEAREKWNERARRRAEGFETRGLDELSTRSREAQEARPFHRGAQGLAHAARGMLAQKDARVMDALASIAVPTLVIVGDRDEPFVAACEYMAKKIPGARLEVIRDAGHATNLDQPEAFNRVLRDFLDTLP